MDTIPQSDTKRDTSKSVRVTTEVWESVSHEAIDRRSTIAALLGVAWESFMGLSDTKRERMVRALDDAGERVA